MHVNKWWICDDGRYGWHHLHDSSRVLEARRKTAGHHGNGTAATPFETIEWADVVTRLRDDLEAAGRLAVAVSPQLTVEEAWTPLPVAKSIDPEAFLAVGFVPMGEKDEAFPGGSTIRAEKCPNRRGVEQVLGIDGAESFLE